MSMQGDQKEGWHKVLKFKKIDLERAAFRAFDDWDLWASLQQNSSAGPEFCAIFLGRGEHFESSCTPVHFFFFFRYERRRSNDVGRVHTYI